MTRTSSIIAPKRKSNRPKLILCILLGLFVLGMLYGILLIRKNGVDVESGGLLVGFYPKSEGILKKFLSETASTISFLFLPYLLGYWAVGHPLIFLLPFFRGLGIGTYLGALYAIYGWSGMGYSLLIVIPAAMLQLFALLIGCREAIRLASLSFMGFAGKSSGAPGQETLRLYNAKFLFLFGIGMLSVLISVLSYWMFSGLFPVEGLL